MTRRLLLAAAGVAAGLAGAELLARAPGVESALLAPLLYYQEADLPVHRASENPRLLFELRPGAGAVIERRKITVNSLGYRDPERPAAKPSGALRIFCFGGSNIYGAAVNDEETYPRRLEAYLGARLAAPVEVWNAGLSASVLSQNVEQALAALDAFAPDALIFHYSNSGRRAFLKGEPFMRHFRLNPELYEENLAYIPFRGGRWADRLFRRCRAWRAAAIGLNRSGVAGQNNPRYQEEAANLRAFLEFYARHRGGAPVFVVPFADRSAEPFREADVPVLELFREENLPPGAGPEYRHIHPPAPVYEWYARVIGEELLRRPPLAARRRRA